MARTNEDGPVTWGAPAQTGEEMWMKEPYREDVASHSGPESCVVTREGGDEALTGVRVGWVLSREITGIDQGADAVLGSGKQHRSCRYRETRSGPARSETPSMHGISSHGSREIPRLTSDDSTEARVVNPKGVRRR